MNKDSNTFDKMYTVACDVANGCMGESFIYCIDEGEFYIYKQGFWERIHKLKLLLMISENKEYAEINKRSIKVKKQILENLEVLIQKELDCFNKTGYLNFDLGEFDPITCQMYEHNKENYSTFRMPYPYDHLARCILWEKTLLEIFENNIEKIHMLQEFFGYCLTRDVRHEQALLLTGESRTGKSTILEVLGSMIGINNCSFVALKYISDQRYTPMLMNKLVNIETDVSGKAADFDAEFKVITTGEPLNCNQKYLKAFTFRPYCKLALAANNFPRITDPSSALYNRLMLIPCDRVFAKIEQNVDLKKLLKEELSGIFNWAVIGLKRLNERGKFEQKDFMKDAIAELREESNSVEGFFRDHVLENLDGGSVTKEELYEKYQAWAKKNGHGCFSSIKFSQSVYRKYSKVTEKHSQDSHTGKRIWRNLKYVDSKEISEGMQLAKEIDFSE